MRQLRPRFSLLTLATLGWVCLSCVGVGAGKETLVELARRSAPAPVLIERMREIVPASFGPMVSRADLIVRGTVKPMRTYLSGDLYGLLTDYLVTPSRTLYQRSVNTSARPGTTEPIMFTTWGGRTALEGVEVVLRDRDAAELEPGAEVILYLVEESRTRGRYRLASELTGAMGVVGGRIQLLGKPAAYDERFRRFSGVTVEEVEREVRLLKQ